MEEIAAVPANGRKVVSTFTGAGGACLGYRWAGYEVVWASEFIEAARETYRANFDTPVDERDIRDVSASDILDEIGLGVGELDLLEGSPPCASFSMAGKRSAKWGAINKYSEGEQRTDDLFFEFARLVEGVQPKVFCAENVPGLTAGRARGYFKSIVAALEATGYRTRSAILDSQWLGVPQRRKRLFIIGLRNDLDGEIPLPTPLPYRYSMNDAIPELASAVVRYGPHAPFTTKGKEIDTRQPMGAILANTPNLVYLVEPDEEGPDFTGYAIAREWNKLRVGESSDRYFNLVRPDPSDPAPTITQTAGANPGVAGITHPYERRKLSIPEVRRLCGFPDDFKLVGNFAQRWERLGRAVPPPVTRAIGESLLEVL